MTDTPRLAHDLAAPDAARRRSRRHCSSARCRRGAAVAQPANAARFRGEPVTLNFVNAEIEGVARAMSAILRQQFVVDPRVRGTITLYSEEPLTPREAYFNFLAALRGLGFTVVEVSGLYKIVPEADAKLQTGTVDVGSAGRRGDQILTQIFRLNHENANNLVPVLQAADQPEQHDQRQPGQQHARHHRLRRQPAADRQDHRRDGHAGERRRRGHPAALRGRRPTSRR